MPIYRVQQLDEHRVSQGYEYFANRREAQRCAKSNRSTVEARPTPKTKGDVLRVLEWWGGHADNG